MLQHAAKPPGRRGARGDTFADAAREYLEHAERVKGSKPGRLKDYGSMLAEGGTIMQAIGAQAPGSVTVEGLLQAAQARAASSRTVNKLRGMVGAVFNLAVRRGTCAIDPRATDRRRAGGPAIETYGAAEVEMLAAAAANERPRRQCPVHAPAERAVPPSRDRMSGPTHRQPLPFPKRS